MQVIFFSPKIEKFLNSLELPASSKSAKYIKLLETYGNNIGMPYSKQLFPNLYELRVRGQQEIRIFYCYHRNQAVILHAFMKKSQKTPHTEIETAQNRIRSLT